MCPVNNGAAAAAAAAAAATAGRPEPGQKVSLNPAEPPTAT